MASRPLRILLLNQAFHPDHVATALVLSDFARALVKRGHDVTAVSSSRGYDAAAQRYAAEEEWHGVKIRRIWTPGLGKSRKWRRLADFAAFWISAIWILMKLPRFDVTVCLTSPPLISTLGTFMAVMKGGRVVPWIMDLNPDEAVAAGWLREGGLPERLMTTLQNWSFSMAARIIVLDRFMAERLRKKGVAEDVIHVDPPWSHDQIVSYDVEARNRFRTEHGLTGKFVVMYSGNHSPCHPLDTVLAAAEALAGDSDIHFLFVGGGSEFAKVRAFAETRRLANVTALPYQPVEALSGSLAAADLHLVVMGDAFVGIVHPCKIYNILSLGIPFLFIGPGESHVGDLTAILGDPCFCLRARHGDTEGVVRQIRAAKQRRAKVPDDKARALAAAFSQQRLCGRLTELIELTGAAPLT
ncbi:MAG: glycosyltransferase family 4 protein [Verrucomicrobiaceae bacterium]|nr:glycosyltransferase family 4 protein [Verrucomicrobiaceae bacterium]